MIRSFGGKRRIVTNHLKLTFMRKQNFIFNDLGTITAIVAKSNKALNYLKDNLCTESWQWSDKVLYIDSRYFEDIQELFF